MKKFLIFTVMLLSMMVIQFSSNVVYATSSSITTSTVFPAKTIRIRFNDCFTLTNTTPTTNVVRTQSNGFDLMKITYNPDPDFGGSDFTINGVQIIWRHPYGTQLGTPYYAGYVDVDMSEWSLAKRTVSATNSTWLSNFGITWEELFIVTFNSNGGSAVSPYTTVQYDTIITAPTVPTKSGHVIKGWFKEDTLVNQWNFSTDTVTEDITLYAKWTAVDGNIFTNTTLLPQTAVLRIRFNVSDVETLMASLSSFKSIISTNIGGSYFIFANADLFQIGNDILYENGSWNSDYASNGYIDVNSIVGEGWFNSTWRLDVYYYSTDLNVANTLELTWEEVATWTVSFNSNGGSALDPLTEVVDGSTITAPTEPTRTGYTFDAWYSDELLTTEWDVDVDIVTDNMTLYAGWDINTYTVSYDSNGGSVVDDELNVEHGSTIEAPTPPTKTGYTFDAWYSDIGLSTTWTFATGEVTDNMTLYAGWDLIPVPPSQMLAAGLVPVLVAIVPIVSMVVVIKSPGLTPVNKIVTITFIIIITLIFMQVIASLL
jgi:uncharacterized repeat protein (TIGR02543 family)